MRDGWWRLNARMLNLYMALMRNLDVFLDSVNISPSNHLSAVSFAMLCEHIRRKFAINEWSGQWHMSLSLSNATRRQWVWINFGSSDGVLPDGTKPWPIPMLTYQLWVSGIFAWEKFKSERLRYHSAFWVWKPYFKCTAISLRAQWVDQYWNWTCAFFLTFI